MGHSLVVEKGVGTGTQFFIKKEGGRRVESQSILRRGVQFDFGSTRSLVRPVQITEKDRRSRRGIFDLLEQFLLSTEGKETTGRDDTRSQNSRESGIGSR